MCVCVFCLQGLSSCQHERRATRSTGSSPAFSARGGISRLMHSLSFSLVSLFLILSVSSSTHTHTHRHTHTHTYTHSHTHTQHAPVLSLQPHAHCLVWWRYERQIHAIDPPSLPPSFRPIEFK